MPSIVALPIVSACINKNILHTINSTNSQYYLSYINCDDIKFLLNKTVGEIENQFDIKIINYIQTDEQNFEHPSAERIISGGLLVYIATKEIQFNDNNIANLFQKKINSDIFDSESSNIFDFTNRFNFIPGIKKVLFLYALLITLSVIVFSVNLNISIIDAYYFVVTTTTTVGYGDINLQNTSFWIKLYGSFTMLAGAALLATLFSVITDNIISKRIGVFAGKYSRKIKNHIIIVGLGSVGLEVVNYLLKMKIKTVVIERDIENKKIVLLRNKLPILIGDATQPKVLIKAGIKKAKTLASLIDDDLNNINIIIKGNSQKEDLHTVARIFSKELNSKAKDKFQVDNVVSASSIGVPFIISKLLNNDVVWSGYINRKIYSLIRIRVNSDFNLNNYFNYGLYPIIVKRDDKLLYAVKNMIFQDNDQVYLFSDYNSLIKL